ncbi:MAG: NAD(P)-dependent oxidoreductase, partial [bacterium]
MVSNKSLNIVVMRKTVHRIPIENYVREIEDRLPGHSVKLARTPDQERELIKTADVVTGKGITEDIVRSAERLQLFACTFAGVDHLPLDVLADEDVSVTNASGVHGPNIAEHVIGTILMFTRRFQQGFRKNQRREWCHYQAGELKGKTVTIVGPGAIGSAVARRLGPFGVERVGLRRTPK